MALLKKLPDVIALDPLESLEVRILEAARQRALADAGNAQVQLLAAVGRFAAAHKIPVEQQPQWEIETETCVLRRKKD